MELEELENKLKNMTVPPIDKLKHADLMAYATSRAKDRSVLSWWWLSIPLYIMAMFMMKSFFIQGTTWRTIVKNFAAQQKFACLLLFAIIPVVSVIINFITIRKIHYLLGNPAFLNILNKIWLHVTLIFASLILIILYLII